MTERFPKETVNFGNASQEEDPIFLARSYMMYKIGELFFFFYMFTYGYFGNFFQNDRKIRLVYRERNLTDMHPQIDLKKKKINAPMTLKT